MQLYIAIEYDVNGMINDYGSAEQTPKEAWYAVSDVFDKNSTKIHPILTTVTFPIED